MLSQLVAKAEGFGEVLKVERVNAGYYIFLIKRSSPANFDLPYMTIRGLRPELGLELGTYDMDAETAFREYNYRVARGNS